MRTLGNIRAEKYPLPTLFGKGPPSDYSGLEGVPMRLEVEFAVLVTLL